MTRNGDQMIRMMIMVSMAMMITMIMNTCWSQPCPCSSSPCSPPCSTSTPPDPRCRHQNIVSYFLKEIFDTKTTTTNAYFSSSPRSGQQNIISYFLQEIFVTLSFVTPNICQNYKYLLEQQSSPLVQRADQGTVAARATAASHFCKILTIINSLWATENVASPATIFCKIWNIRSYEYEPLHICLWITENVASHATKASHYERFCVRQFWWPLIHFCLCVNKQWLWVMMTLYIFVCI